ncbi:unannotated protein [freshwater metagenome]|uniref:Unannotated protein n=1 Tax=freshwater metagenome TaxID=449393 RepID=A0A6J7EHZ0_9ZZZZ
MPAAMSIEALTCGYCLRASTAALQKNGRNESLTPSRASKFAFTVLRRREMPVTSTSITVVSCAEVWSDSTMRSAMTLRRRGIFSVRPRRGETSAGAGVFAEAVAAGAEGAVVGTLAGAGADDAGAADRPAAAARTSCLRTRPPTPVPMTVDRSMPSWAASRRTSGVT